MNKLRLFRIIGESFARTYTVGGHAERFFKETAKEMYPHNVNRRAWALSNMELFHDQEMERIAIMKRLSDTPAITAHEILEGIRRS